MVAAVCHTCPVAWLRRGDLERFLNKEGTSIAYLLIYIDDIILTTSSPNLLQRITTCLHSESAMTDLGDLYHFHGIAVTWSTDGPVPVSTIVRHRRSIVGGHGQGLLHRDTS